MLFVKQILLFNKTAVKSKLHYYNHGGAVLFAFSLTTFGKLFILTNSCFNKECCSNWKTCIVSPGKKVKSFQIALNISLIENHQQSAETRFVANKPQWLLRHIGGITKAENGEIKHWLWSRQSQDVFFLVRINAA